MDDAVADQVREAKVIAEHFLRAGGGMGEAGFRKNEQAEKALG